MDNRTLEQKLSEANQTVSPFDPMFHRKDGDANVKKWYFKQGIETIFLIQNLLNFLNYNFSEMTRILDYGAGFGRLTRYFSSVVGNSNVVACDISLKAVDFCHEVLGVQSIHVTEPYDNIDLGKDKFDLIFC